MEKKKLTREALAGVCMILSLVCLLLSRTADARAEPEIVARVNGEPVTRAEIQRMLDAPVTRDQLERELGIPMPGNEELESLALRKLIERRLILQEARNRKLTVNEKDVDKAVAALRSRFGDLKDFGVWMKEQGLDDKNLFETLRTEMIAKRLLASVVEGVGVSEEQVKEYYEAHTEDLKTEGDVRLRIIAVRDRAPAEEILAALQRGEKFSSLARQRSIGMRAAQGGDTGWVDPQTLPPPVREALGALKVGDVGGPIQKGEEYLIVRLVGQRPERTKSLTEARPEIEQHLLSAKQQKAVQTWLAEKKGKAKIEMFIRETGRGD